MQANTLACTSHITCARISDHPVTMITIEPLKGTYRTTTGDVVHAPQLKSF